VGKEIANQLARDIGNFDVLCGMSISDLTNQPGLSHVKAEAIYKFLHAKENQKTLQVLKTLLPGMNGPATLTVPKNQKDNSEKVVEDKGEFSGKAFVFTGIMHAFTRAQSQDYAVKLGGVVRKSITVKVDYLVVGHEGAGEKKLLQARRLGTVIMSEEEFQEIVYKKFGPPP